MQCPSCHKEIPGGAAFCGYCGASIAAASAEQDQTLVHQYGYIQNNNNAYPPQSATTLDRGGAPDQPYPQQHYYEQTLWDQQQPPIQPARKQSKRLPLILTAVLVVVVVVVALFIRSFTNPSTSQGIQTQGQGTTPTSTTSGAIHYPSQYEAQSAISYYYAHVSDFAGKQVIQHFDSVTYGALHNTEQPPSFVACAQYAYATIKTPNKPVKTARHTFTFHYGGQAWHVITMGNWDSC